MADNSIISSAGEVVSSDFGGVSGRATTLNTSAGIPGAQVMLVNASDISHVIAVTTCDANGFYQFCGVPSTYDPATGTYANAYKLRAVKNGAGEGFSNSFSVEPDTTTAANVVLVPEPGAVSGRITTSNTSLGLGNAAVLLVNASDAGRCTLRP